MKITHSPDRRRASALTAHGSQPPRGRAGLARERSDGYDAGDDHAERVGGDEACVGPSLRNKVAQLSRLAGECLALATDGDEAAVEGGELGGLLDLLAAIDAANAAAVELTMRSRRHGRSERATGLPLDHLLAFSSKATYGDRRTLLSVAETLPSLPNVRTAFRSGVLGWAQVRAICAEVGTLNAEQRDRFDAGFADHDRLRRLDPDVLVDEARTAADRLRPDLHERREVRRLERRYFHAQPDLEGGISGQFELAGEAGATLLEAIDAAAPPPSAGPRDHTRDATGHAADDQPESETAEGLPAFTDPIERRSLARRRADGLVAMAEAYLAGTGPPAAPTTEAPGTGPAASAAGTGRPARRSRPTMTAIADIRTLSGDDAAAHAARALLASFAGRLHLTPEATRRLAENADLRFLVTDDGEVLGVSEPTSAIPAAVRAAVEARDQGCRFAGCTAPIHWCDLHHVRFRSDGGSTKVDNLVAVCRRHHTAVHQGGWRLTMTPQGVVTVRRGRHRHTTDPPLRRDLLGD